jgi:RNA polymerase sigma-70 factor (ECF subfamily)
VDFLAAPKETHREVFLNELQSDIQEALNKLSVKHRAAIVFAEIEGLSVEAIGEIMGCSVGTVCSRIHYARAALKISLAHYMKDDK